MSLQSPPEAHYTVYRLTDPNGKIYIGCTEKTVEERWKKGRGYNRKTPIRRAINEIGWDAFEKKILCEKLTKEGAEKLEKWFIAYYDSSDPEKGYNRMLGGLGKGARMSEITKKISSEAKSRMYAEKPEVIEKIRHTVNEIYANDPALSMAMRKRAKAVYEKEPERREKVRRRMREYLSRPENRAFVDSDRHARPVRCVETGEVFPSQRAAERATGFRSIHSVCAGRYRTSGGYHWEYVSAS